MTVFKCSLRDDCTRNLNIAEPNPPFWSFIGRASSNGGSDSSTMEMEISMSSVKRLVDKGHVLTLSFPPFLPPSLTVFLRTLLALG